MALQELRPYHVILFSSWHNGAAARLLSISSCFVNRSCKGAGGEETFYILNFSYFIYFLFYCWIAYYVCARSGNFDSFQCHKKRRNYKIVPLSKYITPLEVKIESSKKTRRRYLHSSWCVLQRFMRIKV